MMLMMMTLVCVYGAEHEPWVFFHGTEYYFASKLFPWGSVFFVCKMIGADLLSVHSREELDFIREHINKVLYVFMYL